VIYQAYTSTNKRKKTRPEKRPTLYTIWCLFSGSRVFTESSSTRRGEALKIINHLSQAGPLLPHAPMLCSPKSHNLNENKLFSADFSMSYVIILTQYSYNKNLWTKASAVRF